MAKPLEINPKDIEITFEHIEGQACECNMPIDEQVYNKLKDILHYDREGHIYVGGKDCCDIQSFLIDLLSDEYGKRSYTHFAYVYNFENPMEPKVITLEANEIEEIKKDFHDYGRFIRNYIFQLLQSKTEESKEKLLKRRMALYFEHRFKKYEEHLELIKYIRNVEGDIVTNFNYCMQIDSLSEELMLDEALVINKLFDSRKYMPNIINEGQWNRDQTYKNQVDYYDLFGRVVVQEEEEECQPMHSLIKGGMFHGNNNRFLIINVQDILSSSLVYDKFKTCLITREITLDNIQEKCRGISIRHIQPEAIPLDIRIILIGEQSIYHKLCEVDNQFNNIFQHNICVEEEMVFSSYNEACYFEYLRGLGHNKTVASALIKIMISETGNRCKISTNIKKLHRLIHISRNIAYNDKSVLTPEYIDKGMNVLSGKSVLENKRKQLLEDQSVILNVNGEVVGQANGIAVSETTNCSIARAVRITCTVGKGNEDIISIEDQCKVSGKIFNKGMCIIRGYLNEKVLYRLKVSYGCHVCFEQLYGMLEGDSAMVGILVTILSAYSNYKVKQCIGITGAMDQKGNVLPVGSVSEKIEGFYETCKVLGRHKNQSVIIPSRNYNDVILKQEIVEEIEGNRFHIYTVESIEDVIEIMFGVSMEEIIDKIVKYRQ